MATLPPYNWRVPLDTDRPAGGRQIRDLAENVAETLGNLTNRYSSSSTRGADAAGGTGVWVPFSAALTIPNAAHGLYLVAAIGSMVRAGGVGTPLQVRVTFAGSNVYEGTVAEVNDDYQRGVSVPIILAWSGTGNLVVSVEARGVLAGCTVKAGARTDVARVSI
jgi:hypothetical protein